MPEIKFELSGEVSKRHFSFGMARTSRTSIIRHLIRNNDYRSYLEIGVRDFRNYDQIDCVRKTAVDPRPFGMDKRHPDEDIRVMLSDEFFDALDASNRYDLIFIDGLHLAGQVEKDMANALRFLAEDGIVVMHDCNPPTEFHQREEYRVNGTLPPWNGTVWKAFAKYRMRDPDLSMAVVNTDWGVGLVKPGRQTTFPVNDDISWPLLDANRKQLMNLISVDQFLDQY